MTPTIHLGCKRRGRRASLGSGAPEKILLREPYVTFFRSVRRGRGGHARGAGWPRGRAGTWPACTGAEEHRADGPLADPGRAAHWTVGRGRHAQPAAGQHLGARSGRCGDRLRHHRTSAGAHPSDTDTLRAWPSDGPRTDELADSDPDDLTGVLLQLGQLAPDANVRGMPSTAGCRCEPASVVTSTKTGPRRYSSAAPCQRQKRAPRGLRVQLSGSVQVAWVRARSPARSSSKLSCRVLGARTSGTAHVPRR